LAIRKARTVNDITLLGEGWIAEEALAIGIYCALNNKWDFAKGVIEAINITGDSDSTGAIAGNILGALNGEDAIPLEWRTNLQEYNIVSIAANDLYVGFEEDENKGEYPNHIPSKNWWNKYPGF
jgi:ADP-ribosylglycohydrolase